MRTRLAQQSLRPGGGSLARVRSKSHPVRGATLNSFRCGDRVRYLRVAELTIASAMYEWPGGARRLRCHASHCAGPNPLSRCDVRLGADAGRSPLCAEFEHAAARGACKIVLTVRLKQKCCWGSSWLPERTISGSVASGHSASAQRSGRTCDAKGRRRPRAAACDRARDWRGVPCSMAGVAGGLPVVSSGIRPLETTGLRFTVRSRIARSSKPIFNRARPATCEPATTTSTSDATPTRPRPRFPNSFHGARQEPRRSHVAASVPRQRRQSA